MIRELQYKAVSSQEKKNNESEKIYKNFYTYISSLFAPEKFFLFFVFKKCRI